MVTVDSQHGKPMPGEQAAVTAAAASKIEHAAACWNVF
jgi:hypothetical protein